MKKLAYLMIAITALTLTACTKSAQLSNYPTSQLPTNPPDEILKNALNLYAQKKAEGLEFANGPCLGKIGDDWVLDIAHNPRQSQDDRTENTCSDFREGKVSHFIELDPEGNLIKSY